MNKQERLAYMKTRFPQLEDNRTDAVLPVSKVEIGETVSELDSFREHKRDEATNKEALTSDEG